MASQNSFGQNLLGEVQNRGITNISDLITGNKRNSPNQNKARTGGLQQFLTQMSKTNGLYRGTFFEVTIYDQRDPTMPFAFNLLCHQASIPGFRLDTVPNTIYSLPYETPIGVAFDPFWCTCFVDNDFSMYDMINQVTFNTDPSIGRINPNTWSPKFRDPQTLLKVEITAFTPNVISTDPGLQTTNVYNPTAPVGVPPVAKTSHDGLPTIATYTLHNAFIKTVQQTPLDWSAHNNISSVVMEICYEWFDPVITGSSTQVQSNNPNAQTKGSPINIGTIMTKYPELGMAYDAAKRTLSQNQALMNNPLLNQLSNALPF